MPAAFAAIASVSGDGRPASHKVSWNWLNRPALEAASGKLVKTVEVEVEQRNRYSLNDDDVIELARYALIIEQHYGRPMDIEWGKDGNDGKLYILQARPETVKSQAEGQVEQRFKLKGQGTVLAWDLRRSLR